MAKSKVIQEPQVVVIAERASGMGLAGIVKGSKRKYRVKLYPHRGRAVILSGYYRLVKSEGVEYKTTHFEDQHVKGWDWRWLAEKNGMSYGTLPEVAHVA